MMAERPVFLPAMTGSLLVEEVPIQFNWHPGLASSQKKKNIVELHHAALARGLGPLLEISSKSELEVGQKLSAFHLKIEVAGKQATVESALIRGAKCSNVVARLRTFTGRKAERQNGMDGFAHQEN